LIVENSILQNRKFAVVLVAAVEAVRLVTVATSNISKQ